MRLASGTCLSHIDDDGATEEERLELVGIPNRGAVEKVLVAALRGQEHTPKNDKKRRGVRGQSGGPKHRGPSLSGHNSRAKTVGPNGRAKRSKNGGPEMAVQHG